MKRDKSVYRLVVVDGHVDCPMKGDIPVDPCRVCPRLIEWKVDDLDPSITCEVAHPNVPPRDDPFRHKPVRRVT